MHTFGYGNNHNSELLGKLASATTGGSYYFIENDSAVGAAFGDALGGVLSVIAQGITMVIEPPLDAPKDTILKVHHDQAIKRGFGAYTVHFGDLYAEETRDILFEIQLIKPDVSGSTPIPHVTITLSYMDTLKKCPINLEPTECLIARPAGKEVADPDAYVTKQWLRISAVNTMKAAQEKANMDEFADARTTLEKWMQDSEKEFEKETALNDDGIMMQLKSDMDELSGLLSRSKYRSSGSMKMKNLSKQHYEQRCQRSDMLQSNCYLTKKKAKMAKHLTK